MEAGSGAGQLLYLYGVTSRSQPLPEGTPASVEAIADSKLVAIVESVSADEFAPEALKTRLQSVECLAHLARKHEAVLEAAIEHGPVIPARLCTLYSDAEAVKTCLAENRERFLAALGRIRGRQEWGLKVFCDETRLRVAAGAADAEVQALDAAAATASPGLAYVFAKKRDARSAEVASARIDDAVDEIIGALEPLRAETHFKSLLPEQATGRRETMVLNLAALVDAAARERFHAAIENLARRFGHDGFAFEVSGPWPAYCFCSD